MTDLLNVTQRKWQRDGTEFIGMRDKGASVAEISERSHCTESYIRTCLTFAELHPLGSAPLKPAHAPKPLPVAPEARKWDDDTRVTLGRKFSAMHAAGKTLTAIAEEVGSNVPRVRRAMRAVEYDPEQPIGIPRPKLITPPRVWTDHSPREPWSYPDELTLRLAREGRAEIEAHWH